MFTTLISDCPRGLPGPQLSQLSMFKAPSLRRHRGQLGPLLFYRASTVLPVLLTCEPEYIFGILRTQQVQPHQCACMICLEGNGRTSGIQSLQLELTLSSTSTMLEENGKK